MLAVEGWKKFHRQAAPGWPYLELASFSLEKYTRSVAGRRQARIEPPNMRAANREPQIEELPRYCNMTTARDEFKMDDRESGPLCNRPGLNARSWANTKTDAPHRPHLSLIRFVLGQRFYGAPWCGIVPKYSRVRYHALRV